MFEEFYEMYKKEEQYIIVLIPYILGAEYHKGSFQDMTALTSGMVLFDSGKEERLECSVTDEERNSEKGWEKLCNRSKLNAIQQSGLTAKINNSHKELLKKHHQKCMVLKIVVLDGL